MSPLPVDANPNQLLGLWNNTPGSIEDSIRALFEAGVEAERARSAAFATVEWGTQRLDGSFPPAVASSKEEAEAVVKTVTITPRRVMRRTAVVGPLETHS